MTRVLFLEPPGDPRHTSGGYRYNGEIGRRLTATRLGELLPVTAEELERGLPRAAQEDGQAVVVLDSLFLTQLEPPAWLERDGARVRLLLHYLPSLNPLLSAEERAPLEVRERAWVAAVGGVLTTSAHLAEVVLRALGVEARVATPGVSACFRERGAEPEPHSDGVRVVSVGPVTRAKGQLDVARAVAASARANAERPHHLVLIGDETADAAYTEEVRRAAEGVELRFTGSLAPELVAAELRAADLFVSASAFESYGMAIAEAAATGTPVVAYRAGEVDRWVQDGKNGYLLEPGDADALSDVLVRLFEDERRVAELRRHGGKLFFPSWEYTFKCFLRGCRGSGSEDANGLAEGPTLYSTCDLPTRYGTFVVKVYRLEEGEEAILISMGDLASADPPFVRVHSECFTGEILHSLKCDCRLQLEVAMQAVAERGRGAVVYLRQEGRGIGLGNKIRAYAEQSKGADTVEANERLGFPADLREFRAAAEILKQEGITRIQLNTNNPDKITSLEANGIAVERVVPSRTVTNPHNVDYLLTKFRALGHAGLEGVLSDPDELGAGGTGPGPTGNGSRRPAALARLDPASTLLLVDLDGVIKFDTGIPDEARALVERLRDAGYTVRFLTNDGINSRATRCAESLAHGMPLDPGEVYTASYLTARYLREQGASSILPLFGSPALDEFEDFAISHTDPAAVVVGDYFPHYDYELLKAAHAALDRGAELVAMHKKRTWPVGDRRVIDVGFWVAGLEYCASRPARVIGKPGAYAYEAVLLDCGFEPDRTVMISDEHDPDLRGAHAVGLHTICFAGKSPSATATAESYDDLADLLGLDSTEVSR